MRTRLFFLTLSALLCSLTAFAQQTIRGRVVDEGGTPVVGAVVMIEGKNVATITDENGIYDIEAREGDKLVFSSLGYQETEATAGKGETLDVVMKLELNVLEDVVVVAYGTQAKSDLTGSVSVVDVADVDNTVHSLDQALQGRISGVEITTVSGEPGAATSIQIRGARSISASNDPLIVVDGVLDAVSSFNEINPSDIKTVSVLKDVSSTALYGARGANGVIMVTTKDGGNTDKLLISFRADMGVSTLLRTLDIMDATEYSRYRNDAIYNYRIYNGNTAAPTAPQELGSTIYPITSPLSKGKGTDWLSTLTRPSISQNYTMSVSQGSKKNRTYLSLGYSNKEGIVIGTGERRFTSLFRTSRTLTPSLHFEGTLSFTGRSTDKNSVRINGNSATAAVCLSPLLTTEDVWNRFGDTSGGTIFNNPYLVATRETNRQDMYYFSLTPRLEWTPVKGLSLKSSLSYYRKFLGAFYYSPSDMPVAQYRKTGGTAQRSSTETSNVLWETTLTWKGNIRGAHSMEAMAGYTMQDTKDDYFSLRGIGYLDDNVTFKNMGSIADARNLTPNTWNREIARMSALGRFNYSYRSRYYLTLTGRADGSSNFSAGNKWAFFPAAAFKWSIANEAFMKNARRSFLTDLSLRLSAGTSGNDAIPAYLSMQALSNSLSGWIFGDTQETEYHPTRLDNSSLTWEKTVSLDGGLDIDLYNHRVVITADAYLSRTTDLLLQVRNAAQTGFSTRYDNTGETRNAGVELSVDTKNVSTRNFLWASTFTISHNRQTVTDTGAGYEYIPTYTVGSGQMVTGYVKGYPVNSLWGFQYGGVWHTEEEILENEATRTYASFKNRTGYARYADVNHDGILNKEDWVYLGSADPVAYGGLRNKFTFFDSLTLDVYFSYSLGGKVYNLTEMWLGSGANQTNAYRYMLNAWHPVRNTESDIPAAYTRDNFASSRYVHDASFLRLKTLSLSYTFPSGRFRHIRGLTLSISGDNVFLLSTYNGFDPDVSSSSKRLDNNAYPYPRTFTGTVNIKF